MDLSEFNKLKERFETLKSEQSRIQGAKDAVIESLRSYGVTSLAEAKERIEVLCQENQETEAEIQALLAKLEKLGV